MASSGVSQAVAKKHKTDSICDRNNIVTTDDKLEALELRRIYLERREKKAKVVRFKAKNTDKKTDSWTDNPEIPSGMEKSERFESRRPRHYG